MIRAIIAKFRLILLGPVMDRLSRLTPGQIQSIIMLAEEDSHPTAAPNQIWRPNMESATSADSILVEVAELKSQIAILTERMDIIERLYKK